MSVQPPFEASPIELSCAELWGGNRWVDSKISMPGVNGHLLSVPSDGTRGGDVHLVTVCNSGMIQRMILGDVVGHGEEVAAVGAEIVKQLRRHLNSVDQARILSRLNRRLERGGFGNLTTLAAVTYVPWLGRLSVSYAGHPPGWLYRAAQQRWVRLATRQHQSDHEPISDLPLAVEPDTQYTHRAEQISAGDRLVLVTDGVLEAPLASGEMLGETGFGQFLEEQTGSAPDKLCHDLCSMLGLSDGQRPADDMSVLVADFESVPRGMIWQGLRNRLRTLFGAKNSVQFGQA
jgi:serine phosphatase RsbU (regulator of sigma subunit)